jgi:hypothetical protein
VVQNCSATNLSNRWCLQYAMMRKRCGIRHMFFTSCTGRAPCAVDQLLAVRCILGWCRQL